MVLPGLLSARGSLVLLLALQAENAKIRRFLKKDWRFSTGFADK
jgi:hypothetical protein